MNLRGFRRQRHVSYPPDFSVDVVSSHSQLPSLWRELWALYDIAYDEVSTWTTSLEAVCTHHRVVWEDDQSRGEACKEATPLLRSWGLDATATEEAGFTLLCDARVEPNGPQSVAWQLAFFSMVLTAGGSREAPSAVVLLLRPAEVQGCVSVLRQLAMRLFQLDASRVSIQTEELLALPTDCNSARVFLLTTDMVSADQQESASGWLQRTAANGAQCSVFRITVPVKCLDAADAATLLEMTATAKENMVLNFCPCCSHCCGEVH